MHLHICLFIFNQLVQVIFLKPVSHMYTFNIGVNSSYDDDDEGDDDDDVEHLIYHIF